VTQREANGNLTTGARVKRKGTAGMRKSLAPSSQSRW